MTVCRARAVFQVQWQGRGGKCIQTLAKQQNGQHWTLIWQSQDPKDSFMHASQDFIMQIHWDITTCDNDSSRVNIPKVYTDVDRNGHMKIVTDIKIQLPHRPVHDELEVKIDGST